MFNGNKMGCFESRVDLTYEEAAIVNGENLLLYTELDFSNLYTKLTQSAENGHISKSGFKDFIAHFRLQAKEERIAAFYEKRIKDDKYPLKFLVTLAALLSKGSVSSKSQAIFDTFMVASHKIMGKKGLNEFLDLSFDLVSVDLPKFAPPPDSNNNYKAEDLVKFLDFTQKGREAVKNEVNEALFVNKSTSVMGPAFVKWAETEDNSKFFGSITLRQVLKHKGKHLAHESSKKLKEESKENTETKEVKVKVGEKGASIEVTETHHSHSHHSHHGEKDS